MLDLVTRVEYAVIVGTSDDASCGTISELPDRLRTKEYLRFIRVVVNFGENQVMPFHDMPRLEVMALIFGFSLFPDVFDSLPELKKFSNVAVIPEDYQFPPSLYRHKSAVLDLRLSKWCMANGWSSDKPHELVLMGRIFCYPRIRESEMPEVCLSPGIPLKDPFYMGLCQACYTLHDHQPPHACVRPMCQAMLGYFRKLVLILGKRNSIHFSSGVIA